MAFTFDATSGGAAANSYMTVEEANDYFAGSTDHADWDALNLLDKQRSLVTATRTLNLEQYGGIKATKSQALEWPRNAVMDYNGYDISGIPPQLKAAVCEMVVWNLMDRIVDDFELEVFESYKVGPLDLKMRAGAYKKFPHSVSDNLAKIGPGVWVGKQKMLDMVR